MRKINKGLVLTIIVLLVLAIYLMNVEMRRKEEKPRIADACEKYIEFVNKYSVLPEKNQIVKPDIFNTTIEVISKEKYEERMTQEEFDDYTDEIKKELRKYYIDNETAVDIQSKIMNGKLQKELKDITKVTKTSQRKIQKIEKYVFDADQVTVKLNTILEKEIKTIDAQTGEEIIKKETMDKYYTSQDEITLKMENGEWKIVYASLVDGLEYGDYGILSETVEM